ncbi:MAG: OmpA family protein [Oligoflexus sp.]
MKMKNLVKFSVAGILCLQLACTQEEKAVEEVVKSEAKSDEHEFKVDEKTGKVHFKAEIVYFGFDEATLTPEGMERLSALADHMKANPQLQVRIEGHCDERGSPEYNLALGQRRAESVRAFLKTHSIPQGNVLAVSFGEEKPASAGEGEENWAQNRRAEFTFIKSDLNEKSPIQNASDVN